MNVLVFNCGSSSLKYRLIEMPSARELAGGEAQRIGPRTAEPARILHRVGGREEKHVVEMSDHAAAFEQVMRLLAGDGGALPDVVGHRLVHGGGLFAENVLLTPQVLSDLERTEPLAPLHNPPAIRLIRACSERYPALPQAVIFDTAFHSSIPHHARTCVLPAALQNLGIRKYGFHGISHQYVSGVAARLLNIEPDKFRAVSCHLGSGGASLCAIEGGRSVDNTMGYSPLQGLLMSTRCGDIDPAVPLGLLARAGGDIPAVDKSLNNRSGVLGLSGLSGDIRDVLAARYRGDDRPGSLPHGDGPGMENIAQLYMWRIRKYLGAYLAVVGRADAVIFTDTIGELVPEVRYGVCAGMEAFGLKIDARRNADPGPLPADVAAPDSDVRILVILTNEELAIARYSYDLAAGARAQGATA